MPKNRHFSIYVQEITGQRLVPRLSKTVLLKLGDSLAITKHNLVEDIVEQVFLAENPEKGDKK